MLLNDFVIGRIHGAIVVATVGTIVVAMIACSVYTRRLLWRSSCATIAPCIHYRRSSPRRTPV